MGTAARAKKVVAKKAARRTREAKVRAAVGELTHKESRFAEEYPIDFNASAAARRAGYATSGKSTPTSDVALRMNASRLLRKPQIQAAIRKVLDELSAHAQVNLARVTQELTLVGFSNGESAAKVRALEILAKILGAFSDNPTVAVTVNIDPEQARERIARRLAILAERN